MKITQVRRDSMTSLHGRPEWVDLHEATGPELAVAGVTGGMFWLAAGIDLPYDNPYARSNADRLARIIDRDDSPEGTGELT